VCLLAYPVEGFVFKSVEKHIFYGGVRVSGGVVHIYVCNDDIFLLKFDHSTRSVAVRKYTVAVPKYTLPILNPQSKELSLLYTHMSKLSSVFLFFFTFYTIKPVFLHILLDKVSIRCIIVYIGHSSIQNFTTF